MNNQVLTQNLNQINPTQSTQHLESGKILFFPEHYFPVINEALMTPSILDAKHKNLSYDYKKNKLGVFKNHTPGLDQDLKKMMQSYAEFAQNLVEIALPAYIPHLQWGRTSFRPAEIKDRKSSKLKDDTRLHVDSFASTPVHGLRILRVFCNINPRQEVRTWNVGESFTEVLSKFAPKIPNYSPYKAKILQLVKATKTLRPAYDHYMLHLHNAMKKDDSYQARVQKIQVDFPAQSSWIVFTDQVSHAALKGQYLLEQTFYLPAEKMLNPNLSPIEKWKELRNF